MRPNPDKNVGKSEFVPLHRSIDELISRPVFDFNVKAVAPQKNVGCCKGDTLVAIEEAMVVPKRLHERRRFLFERIVVTRLRTENCGLNRTFISNAMQATEHVDEPVLHLVDFCDRQVFRHRFEPIVWIVEKSPVQPRRRTNDVSSGP